MKRILSLCAGIVVAFLAMSTSAFAQCGNPGQRACCSGLGEYAGGTQATPGGVGRACITGASYSTTNGCTDPAGCLCPGGIINAGAMCLQSTGCGGDGQRACCIGISEVASGTSDSPCQDGMVPITGTASNPIPPCSSADPAHCVCGGPSANVGAVASYATQTCAVLTPCGGAGQRACCTGNTETAISGQLATCQKDLTTVPGCSGDCWCGGDNILNTFATQSCTTIEAIAEPTTNATPTPVEPDGTLPGSWSLPQAPLLAGPECPLTGACGYADLHVHMFANLAHGGAFVAGEPWDPAGVNTALGEDYGWSPATHSNQSLVDNKGNPKPSVNVIGAPGCPDYLLNASSGNLCSGQVLFHGDHTAIDTSTGGGTNDGAASNLGVPLFNGWPLWTSTVHQQVYYKWLERAWLGGLRLMVMLAVSNEALCKAGTVVSGTNCASSMAAIDAQLAAVNTFQTWLDGMYGGPGKGWFQIVTTPLQAQTVIAQGKLAVVLGIEVDNIFDCHRTDASGGPLNGEGPNCDPNTNPNYVPQQLQKYYGMGVRHIFPIHDFDNAFGPTATWQDAINAGQREGEGAWQDAVNCPADDGTPADGGYGFYMDPVTDGAIALLAFGIDEQPKYPTFTSGSCANSPGITTAGNLLLTQAMNMGFIIDVDHMSINGFNFALNLATTQSPVYAGIAASHVQFFDLYHQNYPGTGHFGRHERMRTYSQLQQIANAGGMIGVMLKDDAQDTGNGWCLPQGNCPFGTTNGGQLGGPGPFFTYNYNGKNAPFNNNGLLQQNCLYSTTETAQQYLYGVQAMSLLNSGGQMSLAGGVALGSDFMGIAGHVGPRFGNGACGGNLSEVGLQGFAQNKLQYPFTLAGITFDKQVSGQKTYDFNVDGLAHIGLFPDMIADMKQVGVTPEQLQPLFSSAQAYVNMWSAVFKAPAPTVSLSGVPATAAYQSTFTVMTSNGGTTASVPTISVSGVCSISGAVVTMTSGTGTCSVTAKWAADGDTYAAATITQTANAATIAQTVSFFEAPQSAPYQTSFRIEGTSNTGEEATVTMTGPCLLDGGVLTFTPPNITTGAIRMTSGTGTCLLTAKWPGDSNWSPATLTQTTIASKIAPNASLTGVPQTAQYNSSFTVATGTNASTTATISTTGACTNNGTTITMTSGTGYCFPWANWAADSNYTAQSIRGQTLASKIPLTVSANNAPITFGQAIPTFTASYSGFVNNENQSVLSGSPSLTTTATQFSPPGTYTITAAVGTLASANYSFPTFNNGTLTINATAAAPPSGSACNGAYQGGTFTGNITVTPNQICEIDGAVVNGNVTSTGGVVILLNGTTVTGSVNISGTATGSDATVPLQVCGATVNSNLSIQNDSSAITLGGTSCGTTAVGGHLIVQSDSGAVSITSLSVTGNLTVQGNKGTVLVSGNTVGKGLHVQNNTDAATNATQVLNNHVSQNLVCSGNTSITGQGNTAKSKQGQCATF